MANSSANDWDESAPVITDARRLGAGEILNLRKAVRGRLNKEHVAAVTGDVTTSAGGGEHKEGSAKAYHQSAAPTLRPDGVTALDSSDEGRIWIDSDDGLWYRWNGSAWVAQTTTAQSFDLPGGPLSGETWTYGGSALPLAAAFATPITINGLRPGKWMVWALGVANNNNPGTTSMTINTVTRSFVNSNDGDTVYPFMLCFRVEVTGSPTGALSITAFSTGDAGVLRLESLSGVFLHA